MKLPLILLLLLIICIFGIAIVMSIYLHHSSTSAPYFHNEKHGRHVSSARHVSEKMNLDYTMHWPEMTIFFQCEKIQDTLFLSWLGATAKQERYLFIFTDKEAFRAFLSACEKIFDENEVPAFMFDAVYRENGLVSEIQDQVLLFMQKYHYSYQGVVQDDGSFSHLSGINVAVAIVGTGYSACCLYSTSGDNEDYDWAAQLRSDMFHSKKDEYLSSLMNMLNRTFDLHIPFGVWKAKVQMVTQMIPESMHWFYPYIEKSENTVCMYYENDSLMMENEDILLSSAKKHSVKIKKESESVSCSFMMIDSSLFERCQRVVEQVYQTESIPVFMNVQLSQQIHLGCNVIHFAPLLNHSRYGASDSILFYEQFLITKKS